MKIDMYISIGVSPSVGGHLGSKSENISENFSLKVFEVNTWFPLVLIRQMAKGRYQERRKAKVYHIR